MKLYSYSSKLLTFVEARRIKAKFITVGILFGIVIPFGVMRLNQPVRFTFGFRSASTLAAENDFLQQQVSFISPRVSKFEMQATRLNERANNLHLLLHSSKMMGDTVLRFTIMTKELKHHSLILAAKSFRP